MLTEDDLTRLLGEAAEAYEVPTEGPGFVLEELSDVPAKPWKQRRGLQLGAAAALVVAVALVVPSLGGGGASHSDSSALKSAPAVAAPQAFDSSKDLVGAPGQVTGGTVSSLSPAEGYSNGQRAEVPATQDGARIVQTGSVTLVVDKGKVDGAVSRLQALATGARGYVSEQSSQPVGDNPSASLTMRVPVAAFDTVVKQIRGLGAKVVSVQSSAKDITATYADTQAQIASLTAARQRFLTILSGAKTIPEILTVQQHVDDVQGQIDRLEGQRRVLAGQSDLATLTVSVSESAPEVLAGSEPSGLSKAWKDAKHGFSSGVESIIGGSGRALLVLLVAGVGVVVLRLGWRLARRRMV